MQNPDPPEGGDHRKPPKGKGIAKETFLKSIKEITIINPDAPDSSSELNIVMTHQEFQTLLENPSQTRNFLLSRDVGASNPQHRESFFDDQAPAPSESSVNQNTNADAGEEEEVEKPVQPSQPRNEAPPPTPTPPRQGSPQGSRDFYHNMTPQELYRLRKFQEYQFRVRQAREFQLRNRSLSRARQEADVEASNPRHGDCLFDDQALAPSESLVNQNENAGAGEEEGDEKPVQPSQPRNEVPPPTPTPPRQGSPQGSDDA